MTFEEFKVAYQPLANRWPERFAKQEFRQVIYDLSKDLGIEWAKKLVIQVLTANDPDFNFNQAIKSEKRKRAEDYSTSENARDLEQMRQNSTGMGLEAMKRKHGAESAWDLVQKTKGNKAI